MPQLLVRDVSAETVAALKERAKKNGRSAEAEHRAILDDAVRKSADDVWAELDRLQDELRKSGRTFDDSTAILREDRDTRR